jgi:hypothetical protein
MIAGIKVKRDRELPLQSRDDHPEWLHVGAANDE